MRRPTTICVALAAALAGFLALSRAKEEDVPLDKLPKAVLETVKGRFAGAELTGAAKEDEDGKTVYEVTIKHQKRAIDVTLSPEGELLMIEKTITAKELPKAVAAALEGKYPKATYKIVEEIVKVEKKEEKLEAYEVLLVTADEKKLEVKLSAEGKIIATEDKSGDKDDD